MNLETFLTEYEKGSFRESDFETQVRAGWYDWFCEDSELAEKLESCYPVLKAITDPVLLTSYTPSFYDRETLSGNHYLSILLQTAGEGETYSISIGDERNPCYYQLSRSGDRFETEYDTDTAEGAAEVLHIWRNEK